MACQLPPRCTRDALRPASVPVQGGRAPGSTASVDNPPVSVDHYENFPVASLLCPPALRPPIAAIYWFARVADDLADEGEASASQRQQELAAYREELHRVAAGAAPGPRWSRVFAALGPAIQAWNLPLRLLDDLLDAFMQDTHQPHYPDRSALLDYCRRSANPVGRLLLHLYRVDDAEALRRSDAVCTALQLINFWQDLKTDARRGRLYLPLQDCARHGVDIASVLAGRDSAALRALLAELAGWARGLMQQGAPLVHQVPGRAGWELRLVVQGGLRILDKLARLDHGSLLQRPRLQAWDVVPMGWHALRMRPAPLPLPRTLA